MNRLGGLVHWGARKFNGNEPTLRSGSLEYAVAHLTRVIPGMGHNRFKRRSGKATSGEAMLAEGCQRSGRKGTNVTPPTSSELTLSSK